MVASSKSGETVKINKFINVNNFTIKNKLKTNEKKGKTILQFIPMLFQNNTAGGLEKF